MRDAECCSELMDNLEIGMDACRDMPVCLAQLQKGKKLFELLSADALLQTVPQAGIGMCRFA